MPMIRRASGSAEFERAAAGLDGQAFFTLAQTPGGIAYYEASLGALSDDSFLVAHEGALVLARVANQPGRVLSHFGFPVEFLSAGCADRAERKRLLREAFVEMDRIAKARGAEIVEFRTTPQNDPDGLLAAMLLGAGAEPGLEFRVQTDLSLSDDELAADMRKGHRQQTRWGDRNLQLVSIDRMAVDPATTERLRLMHAEVSGRVTRPPESWAAAEALVAQGCGGYVLGHLGGELLCGTVTLDGGDIAYYASGIYRREHFDKPLAHASVYRAMLDAKARGRRYFDVGAIRDTGAPVDAKEASIAWFKQGFSSRVVSSTIWRLNVKAT